MAENTYYFLKESGFEPSLELLVRKKLATTEHGKRYHLNIIGNKGTSLFQVDGAQCFVSSWPCWYSDFVRMMTSSTLAWPSPHAAYAQYHCTELE